MFFAWMLGHKTQHQIEGSWVLDKGQIDSLIASLDLLQTPEGGTDIAQGRRDLFDTEAGGDGGSDRSGGIVDIVHTRQRQRQLQLTKRRLHRHLRWPVALGVQTDGGCSHIQRRQLIATVGAAIQPQVGKISDLVDQVLVAANAANDVGSVLGHGAANIGSAQAKVKLSGASLLPKAGYL